MGNMTLSGIKQVWLGIDFSGNHRMWQTNRRSNVYVAEICIRQRRLSLSKLRTVQELPGQEEPFQRLANLLKTKRFRAAAIDAPFSVPSEFLPNGGHKALLQLVAELQPPEGRPFPAAQDFVCRVLSGRSPTSKKPLRRTELDWKEQKINVRSSLWAGPRGGAAMTAACLTLLSKADCPIWPWDQAGQSGLLIEAFPAAQLCYWGMKYEKYNGDSLESKKNRKALVDKLSQKVQVTAKQRRKLEESADALDAVVCAFAAIAVSSGKSSEISSESPIEEGQIAVQVGPLHKRYLR